MSEVYGGLSIIASSKLPGSIATRAVVCVCVYVCGSVRLLSCLSYTDEGRRIHSALKSGGRALWPQDCSRISMREVQRERTHTYTQTQIHTHKNQCVAPRRECL